MNSCYQFIKILNMGQVTLASYSHLIPVVFSLLLGLFIAIKAKFDLSSKIFLAFITTFCLWLIGDLITWTMTNYSLIYFVWSVLDYIEILFYILGLYFIVNFISKKDLSIPRKVILYLISFVPFVITIAGHSVTGFNQPVCEATNSNFLSVYKLIAELVILLTIFYYIVKTYQVEFDKKKRKAGLTVLGSIFALLFVFGGTEYVASITGIYEIHLYSLFLIPVFILIIIYAVFELDIFNFKMLSTRYLVVGLMILIVGQLFFVNGSTDKLLTIITVIISLTLSIILFKNFKRESDQRIKIEQLSKELEIYNVKLEDANERLENQDKLKTEFLSLASHQLRSPLTAIKGYSSMILEGSYGPISNDAQKEAVSRVFQSSLNLAKVVDDLLNISKIEQGGMKYEFAMVDVEKLAKELSNEFALAVASKKLTLDFSIDGNEPYLVKADLIKLRQVFLNFIDNSIKYTKEGFVHVKVSKNKENNLVTFSVTDSGMGMTEETKAKLFQKFSRGEGGSVNAGGSGLGLYLAKEIIDAHGGRVWVESPGIGLGSTFYVEMKAL